MHFPCGMKNNTKIVLIRGLLRDARHWGKFTYLLQQRFPDAEIIAPDIPGNGRLHHLTSSASIDAMTDAIRDQIALRRHLIIVAISMGAMIAIDWMTRYPCEVQSAILINTSARPLSPFYHRLRLAAYPYIVKILFHSSKQREADILALTSNKFGSDNTLLEMWQEWQRQNPVSFASARNQCLAAIKFSMTSRPLHPALVVASKADRLVNYHCSVNLAKVLHAKYAQHDTAGHDLPLDDPVWLTDRIHEWVVLTTDSNSFCNCS